ncbi:MAG: hypothetical protein R3F54_09700 [Alphaproteobacteria bacterium]
MTDNPQKATPKDEVLAFFAGQKKTVLSFLGFSGAGYERPDQMLAEAEKILDRFDPATTIVNIGATSDGIGAVYKLAKEKGFVTTGIVSTQALEAGVDVSPFVDRVFFIEDESWGGCLDDGETLAPTSALMVEVSDTMIAIGGGTIARDEFSAAKRRGRKTAFIPADMNHEAAREKARRKGLPMPASFAGAVAE